MIIAILTGMRWYLIMVLIWELVMLRSFHMPVAKYPICWYWILPCAVPSVSLAYIYICGSFAAPHLFLVWSCQSFNGEPKLNYFLRNSLVFLAGNCLLILWTAAESSQSSLSSLVLLYYYYWIFCLELYTPVCSNYFGTCFAFKQTSSYFCVPWDCLTQCLDLCVHLRISCLINK